MVHSDTFCDLRSTTFRGGGGGHPLPPGTASDPHHVRLLVYFMYFVLLTVKMMTMCLCITITLQQGDSGGPFVCERSGGHVLAGLTSWGSNQCDITLPNVYTRISSFREWIDSKIVN